MTQTVLILVASGRFGRNAALSFENAGWTVSCFDRQRDTLEIAARGVDVIVNGWHTPYSQWDKRVLAMQPAIHRAALANDATVIIPGNVYVFGENTPAPWSDKTEYRAKNPLGRIRIAMEQSYRDAGVRTIVLRAGDFLDTEASGNWFDKIMAPGLKKGVLTYPGALDMQHAWGFLPDIARAAVGLAQQRASLPHFTDVCFPGYTLSGERLGKTIAIARGHTVRVKKMAWWPLRLVSPFMADMPHILEMRYLWHTPHRLDAAHFEALLPDFEMTPAVDALRQATSFVKTPKGSGLATAAI